jgi:hypothetical protein
VRVHVGKRGLTLAKRNFAPLMLGSVARASLVEQAIQAAAGPSGHMAMVERYGMDRVIRRYADLYAALAGG